MTNWTHLYDLADSLYKLAPWQKLAENDYIAIKHPETGEIGYISFMGLRGDHLSLTLYLGEKAMQRINLMHFEPKDEMLALTTADRTNLILETRQLQVSFNKRDVLDKSDLAQIKELGRRYRGGNWPQFQSYQPAHAPGPINDNEAEWLRVALEQSLACASDLLDGSYHANAEQSKQWMIPLRELAQGKWQQTMIPYDSKCFDFPFPEPSELLAAKVKLHNSPRRIQCCCQLLLQPIGNKYGQCLLPYLLLAVDADDGLILGARILTIEDNSLEDFKAGLPDHFLQILDGHSIRPSEIQVSDHSTFCLLHKTSLALECPASFHQHLAALSEAMESMHL